MPSKHMLSGHRIKHSVQTNCFDTRDTSAVNLQVRVCIMCFEIPLHARGVIQTRTPWACVTHGKTRGRDSSSKAGDVHRVIAAQESMLS